MTSLLFAILVFIVSNSYTFSNLYQGTGPKIFFIICYCLFLLFLIAPTIFVKKKNSNKLQMIYNGCIQILVFLISTVLTIVFFLYMIIWGIPFHHEYSISPLFLMLNCIVAAIVEAAVFWFGIIRIYLSSTQIRIKWRIIGIACGMIPIVHLFVLFHILKLAYNEVEFENSKIVLNNSRENFQICDTKYPIIMVHGVFFRDYKLLNYWGRIPEELIKNGARIYYGEQESASSVAESGKQLAEQIQLVLKKSGAEKVNIIAHSKGGLDSRYAISMLGMDEYVASLTTINTPHRGCEFADYLLEKIPKSQQDIISNTYNSALKKMGDENPDFMAAVTDLTASACSRINEEVIDSDKVFYQSVGSCLKVPVGGRFPLNLTTLLVKYFDGKNDGLVGEKSFEWGENYQFLENDNLRGISHGDMIDLNRENIPGFDVREFYVSLVADLKTRGY